MGKISYSQFSQWDKCPQMWKLNYLDKLGTFRGNIYTIFGSATHFINGNVDTQAVLPLCVGAIIGSQFGVIISKRLKGRLMMKLLSFAMIAIAINMGIKGIQGL